MQKNQGRSQEIRLQAESMVQNAAPGGWSGAWQQLKNAVGQGFHRVKTQIEEVELERANSTSWFESAKEMAESWAAGASSPSSTEAPSSTEQA